MLMSIVNPTPMTKPLPLGTSPIRCITTVLLIGWGLSVHYERLQHVYILLCVFFTYIVCIYRCDDV